MTDKLEKKVQQAITLLQSAQTDETEPLEIAYSGGKDSDVILELAKMANINFVPIYRNTTIDPPGTLKHVREAGAVVIQPKKRFFQLIAENGIPGTFYRFCCRTLKEYPVLEKCVIGVRKEESVRRNERYQEPVVCRIYNKRKKQGVQQIMPLLYWTAEEEKEFIMERGIKLHQAYYNEDGTIDVTKRVGCMCCPLKGYRNRLQDFKEHPVMFRQYVRYAKRYFDSHPNSSIHTWAADVYEWMYEEILCYSKKQYLTKHKPNIPTGAHKKILEETFGTSLDF